MIGPWRRRAPDGRVRVGRSGPVLRGLGVFDGARGGGGARVPGGGARPPHGGARGRPIQVETLVMKVRQVQRFIFAIDVLDGYARR